MTKPLSILLVILLFSLSGQSQSIPKEERILKAIIKFRDSFVASKFDADAVTKGTGWSKFVCDESPPQVIEEIEEIVIAEETVVKQKVKDVDTYPLSATFVNASAFNVAIWYNSVALNTIVEPFGEGDKYVSEVNKVVAYLKKVGKKTNIGDYFYLNNYFRLDESGNNYRGSANFKMLEKEFYPDGFTRFKTVNVDER